MSRVTIALTQETEAVKVVVTNDGWADDDPAYAQNADGWPRILSRLKTLLETGKTFDRTDRRGCRRPCSPRTANEEVSIPTGLSKWTPDQGSAGGSRGA